MTTQNQPIDKPCQSCSFGHLVYNVVRRYSLVDPIEGWGKRGATVLLCDDCAAYPLSSGMITEDAR